MVNSTASGGGVAEMLPRMIYTFRDFNINVKWWVIHAFGNNEFFDMTKKIHNFIHGRNPGNKSLTFTE